MGLFDKKKVEKEDAEKLIARKEYKRAIELLGDEFRRSSDPRVRMKLADVLAMDAQFDRAIKEYLAIVDTYIHEGFVAKAVAVCKKILKIDPNQPDVNGKLEEIAGHTEGLSGASVLTGSPGPKTGSAATAGRGVETGGEEIGFSGSFELGMEAGESVPLSSVPEPPASALRQAQGERGNEDFSDLPASSPGDFSFAPAGDDGGEAGALSVDVTAVEVSLLDDDAPFEDDDPLDSTVGRRDSVYGTPLFSDLDQQELLAVCRRMELREVQAGETIVREGDEGKSLFVIAEGSVTVYTHTPHGREVFLGRLGDGDFFGEVSVLTTKPRTATIVAEGVASLLELSKDDVDAIVVEHPRVREVLETFHRTRVSRTVEKMISNLKNS